MKKKQAYDFAAKFLDISGLQYVAKRHWGGIGAIFMLHRLATIDDQWLENRLYTTTTQLEESLTYLAKAGIDVVSLSEAVYRLENQIDKHFVCFTFDDGYEDNIRLGLPIFEKYNFPFAIYVCTSLIERTMDYWWGALEKVIFEADEITLELDDKSFVFDCYTPQKKKLACRAASNLIHRNVEHYRPALDHLFAQHNINMEQLLDQVGLRRENISNLSDHKLVNFEAHTVSHRPLSKLSIEQARHEMKASKDTIQSWTQRDVNHFAYPFGSAKECAEREFRLSKDVGFRSSTTTRQGNLYKIHSNQLQSLPRYPMTSQHADLAFFKCQLAGLQSLALNGFRGVAQDAP